MTEDSKWQAISLHDGNDTFEVDGDGYDSAACNALQQLGWSLSPPDDGPARSREIHLAERAVVVALCLVELGVKLGDAGLQAHYNEVANFAQTTFDKYPVNYDWDAHVASGGVCWDLEIENLVHERYG